MNTKIKYIGCNDADMHLFESQYVTPEGMCHNSYLIEGERLAVMDTVDPRTPTAWLSTLSPAPAGRKPHYLIVQHMEPDHSGSISAFRQSYPDTQIVASQKALQYMQQFNPETDLSNTIAVKEGDTLDLGGLTLAFVSAPMVHWPEVIVTYSPELKTLFSADGFGKFGVIDADKDDWACEARRYYFNICGKYGIPVSNLLKKASSLDIETICPLHGPILQGEQLAEALRLYTIWSQYGTETKGILIAHASIHGNTAKVAEKLGEMLRTRGAGKVVVADLCREDMAEIIEDAFRMDRLIVCASSYDGDVFPPMHMFLWKLGLKAFQGRKVGIVENGTWAPSAGRAMTTMIESWKNTDIVEPIITIRSTMKDSDLSALQALVDAMA